MHNADENESGDIQKIEFDAMAAINTPELFPETESKNRHELADRVYLIEEPHRAGEYMPIFEDDHGTYIMNSKDLRAVQHVERLAKIGIDSLKIEGRTKSHYYVARTAQIYRQAIDDAVAGREFNADLYGKLDNLANRGYTEGFYQRHPNQDYQNYLHNHSKLMQQQFVGEVTHFDEANGIAEVLIKNKLKVGDKLEIISPSGNQEITLEKMESLKGEPMQEAPGGGYEVKIPLPGKNYKRALLARYL